MKVSVLLRYLWQLIVIDLGLLISMPIICLLFSSHSLNLSGLFYTMFTIWFICAFLLNCMLIGSFFLIAGFPQSFKDEDILKMHKSNRENKGTFFSKLNLILQILSVFVLGYFGFIIPAVLVFFTSIIYYLIVKLVYKAIEKNIKERQLVIY